MLAILFPRSGSVRVAAVSMMLIGRGNVPPAPKFLGLSSLARVRVMAKPSRVQSLLKRESAMLPTRSGAVVAAKREQVRE